jgi:hypothetical protein
MKRRTVLVAVCEAVAVPGWRARAAHVRLLGVLTWFPGPLGAQGIVEVRK